MASDAKAAGIRDQQLVRAALRRAIAIGLVAGGVCIYLAVVGILLTFNGRWIIVNFLTLGHAVLIAAALGAGIVIGQGIAPRRSRATRWLSLIAGAIAGGAVVALLLLMEAFPLRPIFISLSPALAKMLKFGLETPAAALVLLLGGAVFAWLGAGLQASPPLVRKPLVIGLFVTATIGVFQELLQLMLRHGGIADWARQLLFTWDGLTWRGAGVVFALTAGGVALWTAVAPRTGARRRDLTPPQRRRASLLGFGLAVAGLLFFPAAVGSYIGQVLMLVGLYTLMGMGLNLEVGLAGLLDLGFVAFFAVGAYSTALFTADSPNALASYTALPSLTYWEAMPLAVLISIVVGVIFGIPVLGVRGDYLAVATLGLGEIARVIVQSDMASPLLGGAQGILQIPKPRIGSFELGDPLDLYYLTLASSAVAAYFAWRLENSRLGRAWMALREDEDVAQALGINLVKTKLLAYGLGAAFAGLAGSIFAVMLTSIYPSSFQLLVSINVLALIIVGGMGSLPGVVVGALALIGLPELLREFGEYRFLFYGAALVIMMRLRPEGLWPSAVRRRELHDLKEAVGHHEPDRGAALTTTSGSSDPRGLIG